MYSKQDFLKAVQDLKITFDKFSVEDLMPGVNIELEHGSVNPLTNVTNDDLLLKMKIALAHLNEFPDYYNKEYGLPAFEMSLKNRKIYY